MEFIPALSRRYGPPKHLAPLVELLERSRKEALRVVVSVPPRHGKTETLLHAIAWLLLQDPALQIAYVSYAQRIADKKSRKARDLARRAGVPMAEDAQARGNWRTGVEDGGVWASSVTGSMTAEGFHLIVVDDAVKDRLTAESPTQRENTYDQFQDTIRSRLEPGGSVIVNMARWHQEDLAGMLIRDGFDEMRLPAIDDAGNALWPERWPLSLLEPLKANRYGWESLYQGRPYGKGDRIFPDVVYYEELPKEYRVTFGVDLAYTAKTHSDYCAAVVLAEADGKYYVLDVRREQSSPPDFCEKLRSIEATYPGAHGLWYTSTTELGLADTLRKMLGFPLIGEVATADKFTRAQPVAAAWKAGKILVPRSAPWLRDFVSEVCNFTGVADRHDDQVDALAAAFDLLDRTHLNGNAPRAFATKFEKHDNRGLAQRFQW